MGGQRGYGAGGVWGLRCRVGVWMRMERGKLQQVWGYGCVVSTYREWGGGGASIWDRDPSPPGLGGGPTATMGAPWGGYVMGWGSHCLNGGPVE